MLRQPNGPARPFTFGNRFSSATTAFSSTISPVTEARSESLPSIFGVEKPFVPRSTMKPDRKSVVWGKSVDLGGRRIIKKKKKKIFNCINKFDPTAKNI